MTQVTTEDLATAIEKLLAIQYPKTYRPFSEQQVWIDARDLVGQYRAESATTTPTEVQLMFPSEAMTFAHGSVQELIKNGGELPVVLASPDQSPVAVGAPQTASKWVGEDLVVPTEAAPVASP